MAWQFADAWRSELKKLTQGEGLTVSNSRRHADELLTDFQVTPQRLITLITDVMDTMGTGRPVRALTNAFNVGGEGPRTLSARRAELADDWGLEPSDQTTVRRWERRGLDELVAELETARQSGSNKTRIDALKQRAAETKRPDPTT